jgi:hypothetical protein
MPITILFGGIFVRTFTYLDLNSYKMWDSEYELKIKYKPGIHGQQSVQG